MASHCASSIYKDFLTVEHQYEKSTMQERRRTINPTINDVVEAEDKLINEAKNPLTKLLRKIFYELNIGPKSLSVQMNDYLDNPHNGIGLTRKDRYNHRGNLMKELGGDNISFNVFMKGLKVIGVIDVEFVARLKRRNRRLGEIVVTEHSLYVNCQPEDPSKLEDLDNAKIIEGLSAELGREPAVIQESSNPVESLAEVIAKAKERQG